MVLISTLGALLILLGAVIGGVVERSVAAYRPVVRGFTVLHDEPPVPLTGQIWEARAGLSFGIAGAVGVWLLLWLVAVTAGDSILLGSAHAREISKEDAPQLWNVVEEMTIAAGLPKMPRVYVIDDPGLNAFAVGRKPEKAAVAVTSGLLKRLNRDELQGVIAHELGHIRNLDVQFMTLAAVMVGAIVLLSRVFLRGMFYGGGRRSSSRRGGGGAAILLIVAIVLAVLAPLAAQLLYLACSRRREYLADASSARFTRYPEGLASALQKISTQAVGAADVNRVLAPMYIVNPLAGGALFTLFATHPPTQERIRILRSMAGAGFAAYQEACQKVRGSDAQVVGQRTLEQDTAVAVRAPTAEPATPQQAVERAAAVGVLLDRVGGFVVVPCACGARLKLPPAFSRDTIACPRCGRQHAVPQAEPAAAEAAAPVRPMRYERRGGGWESFRCACGHPVQLSPQFSATHVECPKCKVRIAVTGGADA